MERGSVPPTRRRRVRALVVAAVTVVALAAAGLTWWVLDRREDPQPVAQPEHPLTEPRAREIAEQLTSGEEAELRRAFVVPAEQPLDPGLAEGLAGIDLEIDTGTFEPTGDDTATVEATVTDEGGTSSDWTLALLLTDAGWMVLHTVPTDEVAG